MAQLPVYRQQGNINAQVGQIRDLDTFAQDAKNMQSTGNMLFELSAKWQASKDAVENLDGKNKLNSGIAAILDEASNYNDYSTPEELSQKQNELTQRMNELVPNIVGGFSNNQTAREFEANGQFATQQNVYKLQAIFRDKYGDMYNANLMESGDAALKSFTLTGDENYKKEYFDAIEVGRKAGYISNVQAEKLKLSTDEWNYDYVYSKTLENPYFKASEEIMSKIDPVKQRTLRNFARAEQKRAQAEAAINASAEFFTNPNRKTLSRVYKTNPKSRQNKDLEKIADSSPNFETVSNLDGYANAVSLIKNLANTNTASYNGKKELLEKAGKAAYQIIKSNINNDGSATLNNKEKDKAMQMLYKTMTDSTFREQMKSLPNLNRLKSQELASNPNTLVAREQMQQFDATRAAKAVTEWKKIDDIGKRTSENVLSYFIAGDTKGGMQEYEKGLKAAIRQKYWYIPELQNPNLQTGTKFTINGKVYAFQGFSQKDIIVEAK